MSGYNDGGSVEVGESGIESGGPMVNYTSGVYAMDACRWVCGNADWKGVGVGVSENCVHRTVIQMWSDGVAVVGSARKTDDLDADEKCG